MAAGGVDPNEDLRLVVLPPPCMVESLANKLVRLTALRECCAGSLRRWISNSGEKH
jgi:hypothetical protein